jgi:hypothetical protein
MNLRFAAVLTLIGLLGAFPASAPAANVGGHLAGNPLPDDDRNVSGKPVPEAAWSLGIAVIGVVVVLRRKAA